MTKPTIKNIDFYLIKHQTLIVKAFLDSYTD